MRISLEIGQNGDEAAELRGSFADAADALAVLVVAAVGEVEAEDIHAGGHQPLDFRVARGAEGGNDLGAADHDTSF